MTQHSPRIEIIMKWHSRNHIWPIGMFVLVYTLVFKLVFKICKIDFFPQKSQCLSSSGKKKKLDHEAKLANTSWQSISGTEPKRCLMFRKNTVQPTSLTLMAFLGPWNGWSLRVLIYKSSAGRSIKYEIPMSLAMLPLLLWPLIFSKERKKLNANSFYSS